jgi:hypothetical protein
MYIHEYHDETWGDFQDIIFIISSGKDCFELAVRISNDLRTQIEAPDGLEKFILRNCFKNNSRIIESRDDIEYVEINKKP